MTWVNLYGAMWPSAALRTTANANHLLDAAGEKGAFIFRARRAGSISVIHWRTGAVTTPQDIDVRIETMGTDGFPSGTLWATNTNLVVASAGITANTNYSSTLTAAASVTAGDFYAVVMAPAGTPNLNVFRGIGGALLTELPLQALYTTEWSKSTAQTMSGCIVEYSDGEVETHGLRTITTAAISSSTTPDEVALLIEPQASIKVNAIGVFLQGVATPDDFDIVIYDSGGTPVLTASIDASNLASDLGWFIFPIAETTLTGGSLYRVTIKPTTTNSISISYYTLPSTTIGEKMWGLGAGEIAYSSRTDAGSWSETADRLPFISLYISQVDASTGASGGLLRHPGMSGGILG